MAKFGIDEAGCFSAIRRAFLQLLSRTRAAASLAHWCRYFSGMGAYALKRAILRDNEYYATIVFTKAVRLAVQMAFMLDKRQYYPYDKWTDTFFQRLPRLYEPLGPLVAESVRLSTPWERKLELLNRMADVLDHFMVVDGIINPHPKFAAFTHLWLSPARTRLRRDSDKLPPKLLRHDAGVGSGAYGANSTAGMSSPLDI